MESGRLKYVFKANRAGVSLTDGHKGCEVEAPAMDRRALCSGFVILFGPVLLMVPACLISFMLLSPAPPAVIWLDLFPLFFINAP